MSQLAKTLAGMSTPRFVFTSSGLKSGPLPTGKDYYLDCRNVFDPTGLGMVGTGDDVAVQVKIRDMTAIPPYVALLHDLIVTWPRRRKEWKDPFQHPIKIHTFCAWGIHRSRAMKHILADELRRSGYDVKVE